MINVQPNWLMVVGVFFVGYGLGMLAQSLWLIRKIDKRNRDLKDGEQQ